MNREEEKELRSKIDEIDQDGERLTEWEVEFIARFVDNPGLVRLMTEKQRNIVNRIYTQRVS